MISTVLLPSDGKVLIDGEELTRRNLSQKRRLSVITQEYSMRQDMTMDEVMEYQGRLYYMPRKLIRQKTEELLEFTGLLEYRHKIVRHLSGGMKRKLMICRALMVEPEILLLDEPTAGMDAFSRRQMWNLLRKINSNKMTIILTTHYIEEAQSLCDRIALINNGKLDTVDTPQALIDELGNYAIDEIIDEEIKSRYFAEKSGAIEYLSHTDTKASMRETTLEDVFIERIGRGLGRK
jgi:ABC-type multidrug transport system, ATPase component